MGIGSFGARDGPATGVGINFRLPRRTGLGERYEDVHGAAGGITGSALVVGRSRTGIEGVGIIGSGLWILGDSCEIGGDGMSIDSVSSIGICSPAVTQDPSSVF